MNEKKAFEGSAKIYDLIYKEKDYKKEVEFIEQFFREQKNEKPKIFELGCGTGNYLKILSEKDYEITGIDISKDMLEIARRKCNCRLVESDIADFNLEDKFDICIAMFDVLSYITSNESLIKTFGSIKRHLNEKGLLIFEVWNGPAVLYNHPEQRTREAEDENLKIVRITKPELKAAENIVNIHFKYLIKNKKDKTMEEIEEIHPMRYFFPQEIKILLEKEGFEPLHMSDFLDKEKKPDEKSWGLFVVARKK